MATRDMLSPREADCSTGADYAVLAMEALREPADRAYAKELMDRVADESQFTKDLAAVAIVYKELGEQARAEELLQTAEDYCMSGAEQVYLADGKMKVLGDKPGAEAAMDRALKETNNLDPLIELAKQAMAIIGDNTVVRKILDKAMGKANRAAEFTKLAAGASEVGDKDYASAVFERAGEKLSNVPDLLALAGEMVKTLGDPARAKALYQRALDSAADFPTMVKLIEAAKQAGDSAFMQAVLRKGSELATATTELLDLGLGLVGSGDKSGAKALLEKAETAVNNLDELQKLTDAVKAHFPDDSSWVGRVVTKLEKRQANQAKYVELQNQEQQADSVKKLLALADRAMAELNDPFYTAKLLGKAESMLAGSDYQFQRYRPIILAVDKHLNDKDWLARMLDEAAAKSVDFIRFKDVIYTAAAEMINVEVGRGKARAYLKAREAALRIDPNASVYDYTKLAQLVISDLQDTQWGASLLTEAKAKAQDHFALAHIGQLTGQAGDAAGELALYEQAAQKAGSAQGCMQLADRLRNGGVAALAVKQVYQACGKTLKSPGEKLAWVEGIVDVLKDKAWASQEYAAIEGAFNDTDKARFSQSRMNRVGDEFYPYRQHAA
ncbi:MAG: tetratricopeptide repeat protein [Thiobacillaceae bacterium]